MFRKLILLIVSTVGIFSGSAFAVGLGDYELNSGLNQPLKAKIILLSAGELAEQEVHASLASMQEFEKVGVERLFFLNGIRFETERDDNGNMVIHMSTREPIKEPFLNFLVELNWPNGRMIREYTFLLDPPIFEKSSGTTLQKANSAMKTAEPRAPQTGYKTTKTPTKQQPSFSGTSYGPVSENDTLWSIASKTRPSNQVSIHQTLVAIYRANPNAFANGNINNLMRGEVLQIPDADSISQVPHRAALQDVVMQNRQWKSGGARNIVQNREGDASNNNISNEPRLSLASPSNKSGGAGNSSGLNQQLAETESQLIQSQEKSATLAAENDELRSRLADALDKLETIQKGGAVNIEDTELAALAQSQKDEAGDNAGSDMGDSSLTDSASDASANSGDVANVDDSAIEQMDGAGDSIDANDGLNSDNASDSENAVAKTPIEQPAQNKKPVFVQPKKSGGFMETLSDMGVGLWGGIAALLLLIAFAVFWRMRQRMEEENFQDDLVASAGAGAMDTSDSFELPDVGDDMLVELDMDDDSDEESGSSDDESFDPLGEADIYIAYGKYEQAETLLNEAIEDNPIRSDLKVKLMECYAETEDREKFDSLAQEVSQSVDAEEWSAQIAEMREKAFAGSGAETDEFDLPSTEDIFGEDDSFDSELSDFNSEDSVPNVDSSAEDDESFDIDMDLGDDSENEPTASDAVTETFDSIDEEDFSLDTNDESNVNDSIEGLDDDFSLDLDGEEEDSINLDDDDDMSLDLDDDDFSFDDDEGSEFGSDDDAGDEDEISTKLDLARAYIDMGDGDGAKEILSEVVAEGNDEQQQEAKALIDKIE